MEKIKKTILQALTTGTTATTTGIHYIIIPDLNAVYCFKIGLYTSEKNIGFFDAEINDEMNIFELVNKKLIDNDCGC